MRGGDGGLHLDDEPGGAPGAVLLYCVAGALIALPPRAWRTPLTGWLTLAEAAATPDRPEVLVAGGGGTDCGSRPAREALAAASIPTMAALGAVAVVAVGAVPMVAASVNRTGPGSENTAGHRRSLWQFLTGRTSFGTRRDSCPGSG
jgi:hypothetical protein